MKLNKLFETWGWKQRELPEPPKKPKSKKPREKDYRQDLSKKDSSLDTFMSKNPTMDVSDELLKKQGESNMRKSQRSLKQFFPED